MAVFRQLKKTYPSKVILASIMGRDDAEWERLARLCEENGADAVELNFSCPNMADGGLGSDIGQVPELVERFTAAAQGSRGLRKSCFFRGTSTVVGKAVDIFCGQLSDAAALFFFLQELVHVSQEAL